MPIMGSRSLMSSPVLRAVRGVAAALLAVGSEINKHRAKAAGPAHDRAPAPRRRGQAPPNRSAHDLRWQNGTGPRALCQLGTGADIRLEPAARGAPAGRPRPQLRPYSLILR